MNNITSSEGNSDESASSELNPNITGAVTAFLWVDAAPRAYNETLICLLNMAEIGSVFVAYAPSVDRNSLVVNSPKIEYFEATSLTTAASKVFSGSNELVLCISAPVRPSPDALENANRWMLDDPRIATVSFIANAGGYLSFPHRNTGIALGVDGHDEVSMTKLLRSSEEGRMAPVPLPVAEGAMIMVNRSVWDVCGGFGDIDFDNLRYAIADLSLSGIRRGFNSYLDPYTYVTVPFEGAGPFESAMAREDTRFLLHQRHSYFPEIHDSVRDRSDSILAQSLDFARAKATGLRVLIDGSALGPREMGTQMLIVNLTRSLAAHPEIQSVAVGVPDPSNIPHYASELVQTRNVQFVPAGGLDFPQGPMVDIIHRPFQPASPIPWERWRALAKRSIITVQDLIAYRNPAYFRDWSEWDAYRENFKKQIAECDGVFSISHDVIKSIQEERLPIDAQRVYVVENGADARSKDQPSRIPTAILDRGWAARPFLFVLGATYSHKNRDLAMRVWVRLREKGYNHTLVMVGSSVPYGSTRIEEALLTNPLIQEHLLVLPEVGSEERNWLLKNSSLVVYLTSAEGFGQVPFEAARMGVPTLFVSFGPLRELIDDSTLPTSYELDGLTKRAESLINDSAMAQASMQGTLKYIDKLTWGETAKRSVAAYLDILRNPARVLKI
jgi:glycosyltransferase involved in cell wall biosynthesis